MTLDWKRDLKRVLAILFAALLLAVSIKTFVRAADLFPGGVTGLTVLIQRLCEKFLGFIPDYTPINLALNAFPVYVGFRYVGKKFTLLSLLMIVVSGILTDMLPSYIITYDPLLISVFGGILSGVAVSICLSVDATSGGTDFIAIYLSQKRGVETWNLVLGFNVIIYEQRAHGVSGGDDCSMGYYESQDLVYLAEEMKKKYDIDEGRVYMQGMSMGDIMTMMFSRVCGHLGELLLTIYMLTYGQKLRIAHGKKKWFP